MKAKVEIEDKKRLFKNPILEKLTRTHISIPLIIFFGISIALIIYGTSKMNLGTLDIVLMFISGFFFFTLIEYVIHRFIFHMPHNDPNSKIHYTLHGVHHAFPKDKERLAMPPVVSIVLASAFFYIYWLIFGAKGLPFTSGFLSGYATYLIAHYVIHRFKPPKNFMKRIWIHHSLHHYQNEEKAFGVSSPLWDFIFRTMPEKRKRNSTN